MIDIRSWPTVSIWAGFEPCLPEYIALTLLSHPGLIPSASGCWWFVLPLKAILLSFLWYIKDFFQKSLEVYIYIYININSDYLWMVKYEWFLFSRVCISWILWSEHLLLFITRNIMALFLWSFPPRNRVIGGHLMQFSHCLPSPPITLMEVLKSSIINDCFAYTWSLKAYKTHLL